MNYDILIQNATIYPGNNRPVITNNGYLAIKDGVISALGKMTDLAGDSTANFIKDAKGCLVMPGLINCHCHAAMSLFRGLADDLPLMEWLNNHIFPAEAQFVNSEMVYWCSKLAAAEMIMSGTTLVADGYFFEDQAAKAFSEIGIRAVAAQGVIDFPAPGVPDPAENISYTREYLEQWHKKDPLIQPAVFCHSPYTCDPETLKAAKELTKEKGVPFFIHLAETQTEVEQINKDYDKSPTAHLADLDILDPETICIHCVCLSQEDLDILAQSQAKIVTCPESNMKLACGVAPIPAMMQRGIAIGLGSDGCASNNDLDLFKEMDTLAKLHKLNSMDPTLLPARETLDIATTGGASVLGFNNGIGTLQVGAAADMIILDIDKPHLTPFYNPDLLVYSAKGSDVTESIINGKLVMENGEITTIDLEETKAKVRELAKEVGKFSRQTTISAGLNRLNFE